MTKKNISYFVFANFILSHLVRLTADSSLQLELSVVLLSSFNQSAPHFMERDVSGCKHIESGCVGGRGTLLFCGCVSQLMNWPYVPCGCVSVHKLWVCLAVTA